jgi:ribose-phosphate pyrophosphokinase
LITTAGASRILTVDLHAGQIQGFFNIPVDHLFAAPVLLEHLRQLKNDLVIVSPDAGGVERARAYAKRLEASLAFIDKRRESPNVSQVMNIIGDVSGMLAILVDDMVDTGGTLVRAAYALVENGAKGVYASCTHPVFSGKAEDYLRITHSGNDCDRYHPLKEGQGMPKDQVISISGLLADAIEEFHEDDSVSCLFI